MATRTSEIASAGPAPGRPATAPWCSSRSTTGESAHEDKDAGLPPIATPMTVKIPDPITAPMPSAVKETGPSVFFNAHSGRSDSEISLSIDFVAKICLASALAPAYRRIGAGRFYCILQFRMLYELPLSRVVFCSIFCRLRLSRVAYRLLWPREAFLTFALLSPRAPVRGALGAAALRAARFTFLRSCVSVMLFVFAIKLPIFL